MPSSVQARGKHVTRGWITNASRTLGLLQSRSAPLGAMIGCPDPVRAESKSTRARNGGTWVLSAAPKQVSAVPKQRSVCSGLFGFGRRLSLVSLDLFVGADVSQLSRLSLSIRQSWRKLARAR
jgi:hypothetical protein